MSRHDEWADSLCLDRLNPRDVDAMGTRLYPRGTFGGELQDALREVAALRSRMRETLGWGVTAEMQAAQALANALVKCRDFRELVRRYGPAPSSHAPRPEFRYADGRSIVDGRAVFFRDRPYDHWWEPYQCEESLSLAVEPPGYLDLLHMDAS